jgi:hypothetical protein
MMENMDDILGPIKYPALLLFRCNLSYVCDSNEKAMRLKFQNYHPDWLLSLPHFLRFYSHQQLKLLFPATFLC